MDVSTPYAWFSTFLLFGPPGGGKTKFPSFFQNYVFEDGRIPKIEIADIGHGLWSWDPLPTMDMVYEIKSYTDLVGYLAGVEERNSDIIIVDDLTFLHYKLTMQSAQIRKELMGKEDDLQPDVKKLIEEKKYTGLNFVPPAIRDRGISSEKLRIMLYNLFEMKKILVITCGEQFEAEKIKQGISEKPIYTGKTFREPNLPGKMPNEIPHFVSEVFYVYRSAGAKEVVHKIRFLPDGGRIQCPKDRSGRLKQLSPTGELIYDEEGKLFDKMMQLFPWPEGQRLVKKT